MSTLDDLRRVDSVTSRTYNKLFTAVKSLPDDPQEIALQGISHGETIHRLACAVKLVQMFRDRVPMDSISGASTSFADPSNPSFEKELTVSLRYKQNTLTNIFSCALAAIGWYGVTVFQNTPNSSNPFAQCARVLFRLVWYLKCRSQVIRYLNKNNKLGVINYSMRLASFPDLSRSAQRAALFSASCHPSLVDPTKLAQFIPRFFVKGANEIVYKELEALLTDIQREDLRDANIECEMKLTKLSNPSYFSSKLSLEDSLVAELTTGYEFLLNEINEDPCTYLMRHYLFEIAEDAERTLYQDLFVKAAQKAANLRFKRVKKRYEYVHIVNLDVPPKGYEPHTKKRDAILLNPDKSTISDIFKPSRMFKH